MGRFRWQCESRFVLSRVDTIVKRDIGRLNLHVESTPQAKRRESEFRAPGVREAADLQRVTVDPHFRTGLAPTAAVRSLDEGDGVLGGRSGVGGDPGLHGFELHMASTGVHAGMNGVRQEPGLADDDGVISGQFAIPIPLKTQLVVTPRAAGIPEGRSRTFTTRLERNSSVQATAKPQPEKVAALPRTTSIRRVRGCWVVMVTSGLVFRDGEDPPGSPSTPQHTWTPISHCTPGPRRPPGRVQ